MRLQPDKVLVNAYTNARNFTLPVAKPQEDSMYYFYDLCVSFEGGRGGGGGPR